MGQKYDKKKKKNVRIEIITCLSVVMIFLLTIGISICNYLWDGELYAVQTMFSSIVAVIAITSVLLIQSSEITSEKKTGIYFVICFLAMYLLAQTNQLNAAYHSEEAIFNYHPNTCDRHGYLINGTVFEIQEEDAYVASDDFSVKYLDNINLVFSKPTEAPMVLTIWYKKHNDTEYLDKHSVSIKLSSETSDITLPIHKKNVEGLKFALRGKVGTTFTVGQFKINSKYQNRIQTVLMRVAVWRFFVGLLILSIILMPINGKIPEVFSQNKVLRILSFAGIPVTIFFAFFAVLIRSMVKWLQANVGTIDFSIIVLQLKSPLNGTDSAIIQSIIRKGILPAVIAVLLGFIVFLVIRKCLIISQNLPREKTPEWYKFVAMLIAIAFFAGTLNEKGAETGMWEYLEHLKQVSTFYEDYYVNPNDVAITFPKEKRNLIFIYLESMENTFSDVESGGVMEQNLIPNLTRIADKRISFTNKADGSLGGAYCLKNTEFTIGGIVASTAGMHLEIENTGANYGTLLPNMTNLGDILKEQGYNQVFLCGTEGEFAGRDTYFATHGNYKIEDYNSAKKEGYIDLGYKEFWGHEDLILYERAKDQLTELASKDEPFNLTMLTLDSHFPSGYHCKICEKKYNTQYQNALACSDKQLGDFFGWIKEQPFFENTTIVIVGDHTSMVAEGEQIWKTLPDDYDRTVYNAFCNSVYETNTNGKSLKNINQNGRLFSTMDIFPTTLAALGADIEDNRLGLGTNLFSEIPTLMEELGQDYINDELGKNNRMYHEFY